MFETYQIKSSLTLFVLQLVCMVPTIVSCLLGIGGLSGLLQAANIGLYRSINFSDYHPTQKT